MELTEATDGGTPELGVAAEGEPPESEIYHDSIEDNFASNSESDD